MSVDLVRDDNGWFVPGNKAALGCSTPRPKRRITDHLHRALDEIDKSTGLPFDITIARNVRDAAVAGNMRAVEFITDRVEGKVVQALEVTGRDGGPMETITASMDPQQAARLYQDTLSAPDADVVDVEVQEAAE